jgi:hypothetical protein
VLVDYNKLKVILWGYWTFICCSPKMWVLVIGEKCSQYSASMELILQALTPSAKTFHS